MFMLSEMLKRKVFSISNDVLDCYSLVIELSCCSSINTHRPAAGAHLPRLSNRKFEAFDKGSAYPYIARPGSFIFLSVSSQRLINYSVDIIATQRHLYGLSYHPSIVRYQALVIKQARTGLYSGCAIFYFFLRDADH